MSVRLPHLPDQPQPPTYLVRNQTPKRLEVRGTPNTLKLAPLQQVRVNYRPQHHLGDAVLHARTDRAIAWEREPVTSTRVKGTAWALLVSLLSAGAAVAAVVADPRRWWVIGLASVVAVLCVVIAFALNRPGSGEDSDPAVGEGVQPLTGWRFTKDVALSALQKLALVIVLAVGIMGPTAAIYYGTELSGVLAWSDWQLDLSTDESSYPVIVARVLQILLVVTLALIPGLMYFQYDREKLATLLDRWVHHAFRLDPTLHTISDVDAKYGRRVEEFYGATFECGVATAKRRPTTRSPLYVVTLLLALGWIVVLLNSPADLAVQNGNLVAGSSQAQAQDLPSVQRFLQPAFTPMTCAFLGAYFFTVQVVLLGYVRGDLRPKTYNVVTVRIIVAVILAWMLQGLFGSPDWVLAASFLAGIVPETVLRAIRDAPTQVMHRKWAAAQSANSPGPADRDRADHDQADLDKKVPVDEFEDSSPLLELDGIGIYERTRLAEEGITSIQALARHDLVDLMLSSRIPASRLVDWLDQALLYQHVTPEDRRRLRRAGIRTATELLAVCRNSHSRELLVGQLVEGAARLPVIIQGLRGDEWLTYVSHWRAHDDTREPGRIVYTDCGLEPDEPGAGAHGPAEAEPDKPRPSRPGPLHPAEVVARSHRKRRTTVRTLPTQPAGDPS